MAAINQDDVLSAFYRVLNGDDTFRSLVNSIDKGPKRRNPPPGQERATNPSATIHVLTAPTDPETHLQRGTVLVRIWMDDLPTGQADTKGLGERAARVVDLFHHRPPPHERVWIRQCWVQEPLILPSDQAGEHMASIALHVTVGARV